MSSSCDELTSKQIRFITINTQSIYPVIHELTPKAVTNIINLDTTLNERDHMPSTKMVISQKVFVLEKWYNYQNTQENVLYQNAREN